MRLADLKWTLAVLLVAAPPVRAQAERYELGHRLRAFENAWEKQTDPAARQRTIEPLVRATTAFFSFRLGEAGRALDQARFALEAEQEPAPVRRWATSLYPALEKRLLDVRAAAVTIHLQPFYNVEGPIPPKAVVRARLLAQDDRRLLGEATESLEALPALVKLTWKEASAGDHRLRVEVMVDDMVQHASEQTLSLATDLHERLAALKKMPHEEAFRNVEAQTFGELRKLAALLAEGKTLETDYPAARLLAEAESLPAIIRQETPYYAWPRTGQFWLRLAGGTNKETVRVFIPDKLKKEQPTPLVIALHGVGGSENMFFEGYGAGKIVRLCQERGWILVAPRASALAAPVKTEDVVGELARRWPIDTKHVFLVGHSMGAMQAAQTARRIPEKIAGVAALGGGLRIDAEPMRDVPFFVGVGSRDFALRNARTLHDSLTAAEVKHVDFREYPDVEHLVIVQQALPDVFAFFDAIAKKK